MINYPRTAVGFVKFMESIWDGNNFHLYQSHENATRTAKICGARRTGGTIMDGYHASVYRFPDDPDFISVVIQHNGAAMRIHYRAFAHKTGRRPLTESPNDTL